MQLIPQDRTMKNILITILTLLYSVTNLYSQEPIWNRNRPKEFSEPIFILQVNNAKSFEISDYSTNHKHRFKFINDSIIVSAKTDTKYVLRNNLVLPILNEVDSLEFYSFWKNKKIKKYDSFNAHITEYYEPKNDTGEVELSFKTYVYPDSIVDYSYGFFTYKRTSISTYYADSTITVNNWVDEFGSSTVIEKFTRNSYAEGTNKITRVVYSEKKENSDEPTETKEYILTIKKKKRAIEEILFKTNESGVNNYSIGKIQYGRK